MRIPVKKYSLVKYRYGVGGKYTAFCLTPSLDAPISVERFGKTLKITHKGSKSSLARHFQRKEAAEAWARHNQAEIMAPDWSVLPGTVQR